jgi:hypothetical protein
MVTIKQTLIRAKLADDRDDPTVATLNKATYGLLFFGTPHKGLFIKDILGIIEGDNPRRGLVEELREKSLSLQLQISDFRNLARDYKIVSFYETQQSRRLKWVNRLQAHSYSSSRLTELSRTKRSLGFEEPVNILRQWILTRHCCSFQTIWKSR